ncbi:outer membrane beta-barrel protein [Noviherbaspirillum sp.]|uniref:outer membrane beta-barrel protein n=1 Tax=Noviherbaspirillum sp. TaxID=1926288 RepID=UPI002FE41124
MTLANASRTLGLAALAILASPIAMADDTGWYAGANVGQSRAKIDNERISSSLLGSGYATGSMTNDNRDTAYKIYGGYQINKNFAVEGGYFNFGEFGYTATTVPAGSLNGNIRVQGLNLDLVGILPITEKFSAFGRVGVNYAEARDSFRGTGAVRVSNPNPSKRDTNYKFGVGVQYAFTDALAVRAEAERYRINDAVGNKGDIDLVSIGLVYRFGGPTTTARPVATSYIAPAPAPQPVVVVPPPPAAVAPIPIKVSLSADSLFEFDKSTVKPEGKQALDKLAADLRGASFEIVTVTGHTDRIGSRTYNTKLSMQRAEAVKSYLIQPAGIPSGKITAKGASASNPVTKSSDCKGDKATKALIACLQPDRRVEVEVSGTK